MHRKRIFYKNISCSITKIYIKEITQKTRSLWIILGYQVNSYLCIYIDWVSQRNKHTIKQWEPNSSMISMPRIGSRMMFIINLYGSVANLDYQDNPRDGCITIAPQFIWSSCSLKFSNWITIVLLFDFNRILKVRISEKIFRKGWD